MSWIASGTGLRLARSGVEARARISLLEVTVKR